MRDIIEFSALAIGMMALFSSLIYIFLRDSLFFGLAYVSLMFIPLLSTVIMAKIKLKRPLSSFRIKLPEFGDYGFLKWIAYIALSVAYPLAILGIGIGLAFVFRLPIDLSMSSFWAPIKEKAAKAGVPLEALIIVLYIQLSIAPFINAIFAFGEEAGWRGYLLVRLKEELGINKALVLSGIFWGIWHWPIIILFGHNYGGHKILGLALMIAFTTSIGIYLSWLSERTQSVIFPAIAHGAINAYIGFGIFIVLAGPVIGFPAGVIPSVAAAIIALPCWLDLKKRK